MSFALRARSSVDRLIGRFGGDATVTVRRAATLRNRATGAAYSALAVVGVTAPGATSISLDAVNLDGTMPRGITFTIAGVSGTYTTSAAKAEASGALTGVTFTPALASEAADDAVVTLTARYGSHTYRGAALRPRLTDLQGGSTQSGDLRVYVSASPDPLDPIKDEDVVLVNGSPVQVLSIERLQPAGTIAAYVLHCRGGIS